MSDTTGKEAVEATVLSNLYSRLQTAINDTTNMSNQMERLSNNLCKKDDKALAEKEKEEKADNPTSFTEHLKYSIEHLEKTNGKLYQTLLHLQKTI